MAKGNYRDVQKVYRALFRPLMVIYLAAVLGGSWMVKFVSPELTWLPLVAGLLSAFGVIGLFSLMLWRAFYTDEYSRMKHLEAMMFAAGIILSALTITGFLQMFEVIPAVEVLWFAISFFFLYGGIYKLRGGDECA